MKVYIKSKNYDAKGEFFDGKLVVKKGSSLNKSFKCNFAYNKKVKEYRDDISLVDENGELLKDIEFSSPSTASQFVLGYSSNGWRTWKIDKHVFLESIKEEKKNG